MAEEGICRLTNTHGRFVRSHLIPAALTRPVVPGAPLIQHQSGRRLSRRWTSWHDEELVTRTGEDILSDLDNWAIAALRRQSMIWSGWGRVSTLPATHAVSRMSAIALRCLEPGTMDFARLRLFLLSLLWRAAATSRPEFCEVQMPDEHLEVLRRCLVTRQCPDNDFYPASCTQLSTRGITQNQVPLAETKPVPSLTGPEMQLLPIFRFYFDGLMVHFHRSTSGIVDQMGPMAVNTHPFLVVPLVTYESSFQHANLVNVLRESRP